MKAPVTVALVGISGYGEFYLDALLNDPRAANVRLVGVVDPTPERSPRIADLRARGCPVYPTLQALLDAAPPELLAIAAPTYLHAAMTCAALKVGVNVLCEKPLAGSLADALLVADVHRTSEAFAAIGYQWSFSHAIQQLKRDVMSGVLGQPLRMRSMASYPRGRAYFTRNDWAGRICTAGGDSVTDSPVNNATAHFLHNMLYLLGPTRETSATPLTVQAELYRANDIENYDTAAVRVVVEGGAELLFYTSHAVPIAMGPVLCYEFERAKIYYEAETGGGFIARFDNGTVRRYGDPNADRSLKIWQCIDAVRTGAKIACGIPAAVPHALCVAAAAASMPSVTEFPSDLVTMQGLSGQPMRCVTGLASAMVQCYDQGILPAEHRGLSWSARGERIDLTQTDWQLDRAAKRAIPIHTEANGNGNVHVTNTAAARA
jgi:predicted dehydrogenase